MLVSEIEKNAEMASNRIKDKTCSQIGIESKAYLRR